MDKGSKRITEPREHLFGVVLARAALGVRAVVVTGRTTGSFIAQVLRHCCQYDHFSRCYRTSTNGCTVIPSGDTTRHQ